MTSLLIAIGFGLVIGGAVIATTAGYLAATRSYRRVRNWLAIGFGYVVVIGASAGALVLLLRMCDVLQIRRGSSAWSGAVWSYVAAIFCGFILTLRSEMRWRKSVGLGDKSLQTRGKV